MPINSIISELLPISPVIAGVSSVTPYQIPAGYFDSLADEILYRVTATEQSQTDPVFHIHSNKSLPYRVPAGYFDNLPASVINRITAEESITSKQELETLSPLLSSIGRKMLLSIPVHYFQELDPAVSVNAQPQEDMLPPLLLSARKLETYQLPSGYFTGLPETILTRVKAADRARVIPMSFTRKLVRYAAAASVTGIIAVSGWFYWHQQPASYSAGIALADIKNISSQELQDFADKNTVILPEGNSAPADDLKPEDIKILLSGVSDEELQQYVDQQPLLKDPATTDFN